MTRPLLSLVALLASGATLAALQGGRFRYTDGNLTVLAKSGRSVQTANGYTFTLRGNVELNAAKDGMRMSADQVTCDIVTGKEGQSELRHAVATGRVHAIKNVIGAKGRQTTDIVGTNADLRPQPTGSVLKVDGPVTIQSIDSASRKTMTATGASAVAILEPGTKSSFSSGLRHATLSGPVKVTVVQAAVKGRGAGTLVATGNRMDLTNTGKEPVIVLTGNVAVHGEGASQIGRFTGLARARVRLNDAGEVVGFDTEGGA